MRLEHHTPTTTTITPTLSVLDQQEGRLLSTSLLLLRSPLEPVAVRRGHAPKTPWSAPCREHVFLQLTLNRNCSLPGHVTTSGSPPRTKLRQLACSSSWERGKYCTDICSAISHTDQRSYKGSACSSHLTQHSYRQNGLARDISALVTPTLLRSTIAAGLGLSSVAQLELLQPASMPAARATTNTEVMARARGERSSTVGQVH